MKFLKIRYTSIYISLLISLLLIMVTGAMAFLYLNEKQVIKDVNVQKDLLTKIIVQKKIIIQDLEDLVQKKDAEVEGHKQFIKILRKQGAGNINLSQLQEQVKKATQAVSVLQKIENTDEELLAKYSKVYFLNEHYIPEGLVTIDSKFTVSSKNFKIKKEIDIKLEKMLHEMHSNGLKPVIVSAYRSFAYQETLKARYKKQYGVSAANTFSADQGFSEHQLGSTIDINSEERGTDLPGFDKTEEYTWLVKNAYKYGFVLSYPKNNIYYNYEPWHWRYVGIDLAQYLDKENKFFYDISQREINSYLGRLFD